MERSFCRLAALLAFGCLASQAFLHGRFGPFSSPAKQAVHERDVDAKSVKLSPAAWGQCIAPCWKISCDRSLQASSESSESWWLSASSHALSAGAVLGLVFALTQAPVSANDSMQFADVESQVTIAKKSKEEKKKELEANAQKVEKFTKEKVRTAQDEFRKKYGNADTETASADGGLRSARAGPGLRIVPRKTLQKAKESAGLTFTGLPDLPSVELPTIEGGEAPLGLASGAALSLGIPAIAALATVNSRIEEKKRQEAARRAREAADPTGTIVTAVAGLGAAAIVGNAVLGSLSSMPPPSLPALPSLPSPPATSEAAPASQDAAKLAAAAKAAAQKAADEAKAAADKAAAETKAAAEKAAAQKAAADKAAAEKAAADKKAAEQKAAADKAAAEKAAAQKAAPAAPKPAPAVTPPTPAAPPPAATETKAEPEPSTTSQKIAKKGYFAYMKEKQNQ
ncbi:unnamed protein product [Effrenium voratum]|nr:unnamed protein product [Effrenium voratum]